MFVTNDLIDFAACGALHIKGALSPGLDILETVLEELPTDKAGVRLHGIPSLSPLLTGDGCIGAIAAAALGCRAKPVRAILFNKSPGRNWSLGWHQDRTICVKEKRDAPGFGPWTMKSNMIHVAPSFDLLTRMVTLRAHLDEVPAENAPLIIALGSHTLGPVSVNEVEAVVEHCGTFTCLAEAGDVWIYSTPILHASDAASTPNRRRVLQVDFAAEELPHGLEWLGL